MARLLAVLLALVCAVHAVQGALPVPPLPQQCTGPAQGAVPRSDLNWPTNQTKLAQELSNADKEKVHAACYAKRFPVANWWPEAGWLYLLPVHNITVCPCLQAWET